MRTKVLQQTWSTKGLLHEIQHTLINNERMKDVNTAMTLPKIEREIHQIYIALL